MDSFNSARRELLKFGGMGLAAAATTLPASAYAATKSSIHPTPASSTCAPTAPPATARPSTLPPSTALSKPLRPPAAVPFSFPRERISASPFGSRATSNSTSRRAAPSWPPIRPSPAQTTGYNGGTYDAAEPKTTYDAFQDYGHNHWHNSLIWGEGINDVSITGPGLIYGKGLSFGAGPGRPPGAPPRPPRPAGAPPTYVPRKRGDYPMFQAEQPGVGNKAIALKNCRNVIFRDFSILKGGHFGLLLTGVDNLTIDNLKIDTDRDGMDIDCCKMSASPTAPSTPRGTTASAPSPASPSATTAPPRT